MKKHNLLIIAFLLLISFPIIIPYFHKGFFPTHDGEWAVVRLGDMFRTLRDGQFPPRYSGALNFGYGYPLFNFAYPFPYYLGFFIHLLRFGFVDSIKIIFGFSVLLSTICMYFLSRKLWKSDIAGLISAILYAYLPYRFVDLYVRGSIGESLAFVFFPLLFLLIQQLFDKPHSKIMKICTGVVFGFFVMTHNIMVILFLPSLVVFISANIYFSKQKIKVKPIIVSLLMGLLLSAFFFVPALFEKGNILLSKVPIADRSLYFVTFSQLVIPSFGYGTPTSQDAFSYQIGWPHLIVLFTVLSLIVYFFAKNRKREKEDFLSVIFIFSVFVMILLMFQFSNIIWKLPFLTEINYPWTLLAPIGFMVSLLSGYAVNQKVSSYIAIACTILAVVFFLPYAKPKYYVDRGDNFYLTNAATTTSSNELMPLWVKKHPSQNYKNKVELLKGNGDLRFTHNSKEITVQASLLEDSVIRINTIYYPGWKVLNDGNEVIPDYSNNLGVMDLSLNKGQHVVKLLFNETPLRFVSDLLSLVSIVLFFYL